MSFCRMQRSDALGTSKSFPDQGRGLASPRVSKYVMDGSLFDRHRLQGNPRQGYGPQAMYALNLEYSHVSPWAPWASKDASGDCWYELSHQRAGHDQPRSRVEPSSCRCWLRDTQHAQLLFRSRWQSCPRQFGPGVAPDKSTTIWRHAPTPSVARGRILTWQPACSHDWPDQVVEEIGKASFFI